MRDEVRGLRIRVQVPEPEGEEREPSLLFIHGAGGDSSVWENQTVSLRGKHLAYPVELPGHGRSSGPGEESISAYADGVRGFMESALPPHEWVVAGHSMGGAVALQLALERPSNLKGIILVGTGAKLGVLPVIFRLIQDDPEVFFKTIDQVAYSPSTPEAIREKVSRPIRKCPPQVILGDFKACNTFDVRARLKDIHLPVLILCGEQDKLTPVKYSTFLHENLSGSRLHIIPQAGHMVMCEKPEVTNAAIERFLAEIPLNT